MADKLASTEETGLEDWLDRQLKAVQSGVQEPMTVRDIERHWVPRFSTEEIENLVIPRRTFARRKAARSKLAPEEVDRAVRLARIQTKADRVFGEAERASLWLRSPNARLKGKSPLEVMKGEAGVMLVEQMLVQIDHGIYA
jgi:putative toxin-antitoxin system antitoxin component (TIGR02293 family)